MGRYNHSLAAVVAALLQATPPSRHHMPLGHMAASLQDICRTQVLRTILFPTMVLYQAREVLRYPKEKPVPPAQLTGSRLHALLELDDPT